jgi:hypothetical protein
VHSGFLWGRPEGNRALGRIGVDGKLILNWVSKKWDGEAWTRLIWLRIGQMAGACECNNEPFGSIQCREFLLVAEVSCLLHGLCRQGGQDGQ